MGNCMERCAPKTTEKERAEKGLKLGEGEGEGVLKEVRIVLTNEEIGGSWSRWGEAKRSKLHELVAELAERGRREEGEGRGNRWQPVLESIMEVPESQSFRPPPTPPVPPPRRRRQEIWHSH
ncbi:hypothetical protein HPP92_000599 [Vanilla planifolia]|uniref:Uncharacterized protein n=1 Tax=Vanilla planifolia TaxID=51239 RepID=A0A835VG43_VANPL|nr:hypothetical protein HPP92_000599 [Vanilla planifolia]